MRRGRAVRALVAVLALAGLAVGVATGWFAGAAERGLYASGLWTTGGASTLPPGALDSPAPTARPVTPAPRSTPTDLPAPVLEAAPAERAPSATRVSARVQAVEAAGRGATWSGQVADLTTGRVVYARRADRPAIPASTLKLLTATAALSRLGPEHRFTTSVVRRSGRRIVLVGGGDPYLERTASRTDPQRASLAALARSTATELRQAGTTRVSLDYDASLFSGPAWNPRWPDTYADQVTPVSALWVGEGRAAGVSPGPRVADAPRAAGLAFAKALRARGVGVSEVRAGRAPRSAEVLARVRSAPLAQTVRHLLLTSDNDAAEVLLRHTALAAGRSGSSAAGVRAVRAQLTRLGVWDPDARLADGSGLARASVVPAEVLVDVLRLAASPRRPELRAVLTGLPVAGVEGSLRIRYGDPASSLGRGVVRAKTGTLRQVHGLAGYLRTADGSQLVFAFLLNDAEDGYAAQVWLDRVSTALSRCGC